MLSSLGSEPIDVTPYAEQARIAKERKLVWLAVLYGSTWYIPENTPLSVLKEAQAKLTGRSLDPNLIKRHLYELWLTTRKQAMNENDRNAMLALYAERLSAYPAAQVAYTLVLIASSNKFFPTWSEILEHLEELAAPRAILSTRLNKLIARRQADEQQS